MKIDKLKKGDTIGIVCPSHIASQERHAQSKNILQSLGYRVKIGANAYKNTYGYLASEQERADDFNSMITDDSVKMVLFGGGEGGNEIIPLLDYENIKRSPKFYCSFSDGTSILNAIHSMTKLPVYYGQDPGMFNDLRYYDYKHFLSNFSNEHTSAFMIKSAWRMINGGVCEGILIGGYLRNFALMLGNKYFSFNKDGKYILFLEDHEKFSNIAKVSSFISHIEQHEFIHNVAGLIFGHYSENVPDDLLKRLERFGKKYNMPTVYTDDFGHGVNHAIFPIGGKSALDATDLKLSIFQLVF